MDDFKNQLLLVDKDFIIKTELPDKWSTIYNHINNIYIDFDITSNIVLFIKIYNKIKKYKIDRDLELILYNEADNIYTCIAITYKPIDNEDNSYTISIKTSIDLIYEIYNQFITYIQNINKVFNFNCHIDMSNSNYITASPDDLHNNKITIINNYNIESIIKIYNEVYYELNNYYNNLNKQINLKSLNATYDKNNLVKSIAMDYESEILVATNYLELTKKVEEKIIKDRNQISLINYFEICNKNTIHKLEEINTLLKIKYGNEIIYSIQFNVKNIEEINYLTIDLLISNINLEYIDLFDIIPYYQGNIIINGFIKNTNYFDVSQMKNNLQDIYNFREINNYDYILNIHITNSKYLKIINNIIHFENRCFLKIEGCPLVEFIQNYNNFSKIYINSQLILLITE